MSIVDASIVTALFLQTDGHHAAAVAWLEEARLCSEPLHAPRLLLVELAASLARQSVSSEAIDLALAQVSSMFKIHMVTDEILDRAQDVAIRCKTRGYDSVYLALAVYLGEELLTADREQADRGRTMARTRRL